MCSAIAYGGVDDGVESSPRNGSGDVNSGVGCGRS